MVCTASCWKWQRKRSISENLEHAELQHMGFQCPMCTLLLLPGAELPLMVKSFGLLNYLFPFPSILDAGYPIFDLHLANVLFDIILPSVLVSSL
jgi:hypothetical protein